MAKVQYLSVDVRVHRRTTGHVSGYFQDALDKYSKEGWRLHTVVEQSELMWVLIFEK